MAKRANQTPVALQKSIVATAREIKQHHFSIREMLQKMVVKGETFNLNHAGVDGDWTSPRLLPGTRVSFTVVGGTRTIVSERSGGENVLRLNAPAHVVAKIGWWIGWHQEWTRQSASGFALRACSLSFFYGGVEAAQPDGLAYRAEWGVFDDVEGKSNAAQPHWHAHFGVPGKVANEEHQDIDAVDMRLDGLHLPMAGWTNAGDEPPTCWQFDWKDRDLTILLHWTRRTVVYFQMQMGEEKVARVSPSVLTNETI